MKIISKFFIIIFIILVIPYNVQATDLNVLEQQMQQEANEIMSVIEEQKSDPQAINGLIGGLFITVIISMIFESIVRSFKYAIKEKNENDETDKNDEEILALRKKLWITYGIHFGILLLSFIVIKYIIKMIDMYNIFFLIISICMVEIGPFIQIRMKKKHRRNNDTTH